MTRRIALVVATAATTLLLSGAAHASACVELLQWKHCL